MKSWQNLPALRSVVPRAAPGALGNPLQLQQLWRTENQRSLGILECIQIYRNCGLFHACRDEFLYLLKELSGARSAVGQVYEKGSVITTRGSSGHSVFILHRGKLEAHSRRGRDNMDIVTTTFEPGGFFDEGLVIGSETRRSLTITACSLCHLFEIPVVAFEESLARWPKERRRLKRNSELVWRIARNELKELSPLEEELKAIGGIVEVSVNLSGPVFGAVVAGGNSSSVSPFVPRKHTSSIESITTEKTTGTTSGVTNIDDKETLRRMKQVISDDVLKGYRMPLESSINPKAAGEPCEEDLDTRLLPPIERLTTMQKRKVYAALSAKVYDPKEDKVVSRKDKAVESTRQNSKLALKTMFSMKASGKIRMK